MKVTVAEIKDPDNWDDELTSFNWGLFITRRWLDSVAKPDRKPVYFDFLLDGGIVGKIGGLNIPLYGKEKKRKLFFFSGIAIIQNDPITLKKCKKALIDYAKGNNYHRVILRSFDYNNFINAPVRQFHSFGREEYIIDLNRDRQEIIRGFSRRLKRKAHKAKKEGLLFGSGYSKDLLSKLFELVEQTKKVRIFRNKETADFMMALVDRTVFERLLANNGAKLYYVEYKGEIVCVLLLLCYLGGSYGLLKGTSLIGYKLEASSFIEYEVTLRLREEAYKYYNLGASPMGKAGSGLKTFKNYVGAENFESREEATDFLLPPLHLLNPLLAMKRFLFKIRIPWKIKRKILKIIDNIIDGRDKF